MCTLLTYVLLHTLSCVLHTYHVQLCVHKTAHVMVLMMITMMVFIYLRRWKKGRWRLNGCSVRSSREPSPRQEERGSEKDGERGRRVNSPLCKEREKRENLLWCVYMSVWFLAWLIVSVCLCGSLRVQLSRRMDLEFEELGFTTPLLQWYH